MLDAADFQQAFGAMLAAPDTVADSAIRRALTIHRNTASKAARDALFANFPVVAALVGEDAFAACASSYVDAVPPAEARLCLYGDRFPRFVDAWAAFAEAPYLGDVASVERLVVEALFAADAHVLDPSALASGMNPEAPLRWHPATRTAKTLVPAASLWLAHQPEASEDALETIIWEPELILITRPEDAIEVRAIDVPTRAFLAGATLADAAARAAGEDGDVAQIFASLLGAGAFAAQDQQGELQ
ncbi:DNA-binding domain-containing protein [Novosphingobium sp. TCA1]|jgi:hypothetical protein|uniref:HvfC/BufC N-terminal domain-containing protein n=1 Tax=Novosphingobium sp. TCA1 TaxID=2682474 RepID=UPI0013069220|nr:DNA-binding domain-containing protein [Novosphingobium sp. TCA1]GFE77210.1 hypothetical protein NTCA1_48590 [Novosphingobium sp. TCA1]